MSIQRISIVLLLSLLAGILGGAGLIWLLLVKNLFGFAYSYPFLVSSIENRPVTINQPGKVTIEFDVAVENILNDVTKGTAIIFNKKTPATTVLDGAYILSEAIGQGVAITNDGWFLTATPITAEDFVIHIPTFNGGATYDIEKVIIDPYSETTFFKISAGKEMRVVAFSDSKERSQGETVVAVDSNGKAFLGAILSLDAPLERDEIIRSSEEPVKYTLIALPEGVSRDGVHIYDIDGSLLSITDSEGKFFYTNWGELITNVLRGEKLVRPYFGVHYVLISDLISEERLGLPSLTEGAWILGTATKPPVVRLSPASKTGFSEGEIIVSIERETIKKNRDLDSLLSQYNPGQEISVSVMTTTGIEEERTVLLESF